MDTIKLYQFIIIFFTGTLLSLPSLAQQNNVQGGKINFTKFILRNDKKGIFINWATDNKKVTNYFEIQKSANGKDFKTIALVLGPDPKILTSDSYWCYDKFIRKASKHLYYRLKHVDLNGIEQVSETKLLGKS